jgi:hypothetical protein
VIVLSKTGYDHLDMGKNRQDVAFVTDVGRVLFGDEKKTDFEAVVSRMEHPIKIVLDGCGSTPHSEVGAQLFAQYFAAYGHEAIGSPFEDAADYVMGILANDLIDSDRFRRNNLSFTILACMETETDFVVKYCGDGFMIAITKDGVVEATALDGSIHREDGEYPDYLGYNYIEDRESLLVEHRDQRVGFKTEVLSKELYANVGVATDGWRYVESLDAIEKVRWEESVLADKGKKLSIIINRNLMKFKDDISICI